MPQLCNTARAVFGQLAWTPPILGQRLEVTMGGRWSEDERRAVLDRATENVVTGLVTLNPQPSKGERGFRQFQFILCNRLAR